MSSWQETDLLGKTLIHEGLTDNELKFLKARELFADFKEFEVVGISEKGNVLIEIY